MTSQSAKTLKPQQITVRVGSSFLKGGKVFNVSKIFTNGYKDNCTTKRGCIEVENDIAILKLKCPVTFGPTIQPVCLPSNETEYPYPNGTWAIATGFGKTSSNGTKSNTLMEKSLKNLQTGQGSFIHILLRRVLVMVILVDH